ncbi:hypothetical protein [Magnetospirillum molischianum]|uniref:Uncharacterized protein n=1 Tax=Magnetospirillum molischianum DSM 120 TaxID=1150626 RepID=H8FR18_MAGML|nr:hypothetical protein [Magnetospirillum molischianum]CCG40806.1 conserved hypothetical protein [Magnetospirillum molischianum DSM 120]
MFGWLQALFLDGKARENLSRAKISVRAQASVPKAKPAVQAAAARAKLLREAAEIHRAKRKILDTLSDEDRAKLVSMAILTFLNQGTEPPPDPKTRK